MQFLPNYNEQKGIFNYIIQKYKSNNSSYISIFGAVDTSESSLYNFVDDSLQGRFKSVLDTNEISIQLHHFKVKITHYAVRLTSNYYFSREWQIYDITRGKEDLLAQNKVTKCQSTQTNFYCNQNVIELFETSLNPYINALRFRQVGTRSDGLQKVELKSLEIYGYLSYIDHSHCRDHVYYHSLFCVIFLLQKTS